jgi:hypothetical protein
MKHARTDYDGRIVDTAGEIPDDEPVFIIRGHDPAAKFALAAYVNAARDFGVDHEHLVALNEHAIRMREWERQHPHGPATVPTEVLAHQP